MKNNKFKAVLKNCDFLRYCEQQEHGKHRK